MPRRFITNVKCEFRLCYAYASLNVFVELRELFFGQLFVNIMEVGWKGTLGGGTGSLPLASARRKAVNKK